MKKNPLGMMAFLLAVAIVAFSSYTKQKAKNADDPADSKYLTYNGTGLQSSVGSYNLATAPTEEPDPCPSDATLCWIRVDDVNEDGVIDGSDFTATFNVLDTDHDGTLNDQIEIPDRLEKRQ